MFGLRSRIVFLVVPMLLLSSGKAWADPYWTRTGNCMECHSDNSAGWLTVSQEDAIAGPSGHDVRKVFRAQRGETKPLHAVVGGLPDDADYSVMLNGMTSQAVDGGNFRWSASRADCDWPGWRGEVYTDSLTVHNFPDGPATVQFDMGVASDADYGFYELTFAVIGVDNSDGFAFYSEEKFYLQVTPPNISPTVAIISPLNNTTIRPFPADIEIQANASDVDNGIARVQFYNGVTLLGDDTTSPYAFTWSGVGKGNYTLIARAIDNAGLAADSLPVLIHVRSVPGDTDADNDVDQTDFGCLQRCLNTSGIMVGDPACVDLDLDLDNDVDQADYTIFDGCMSRPNIAADPTCAD